METRYQKGSSQARFKEWAKANPVSLEVKMSAEDVAELTASSVGDLLRYLGRMFIEAVMESEVASMVGPRSSRNQDRPGYRWGGEQGYCVIDGQKVPLRRPRVRTREDREVSLSSYEVFQQTDLLQETVWRKMMQGLTTRNYKEVVQQFADAYGLEKSSVSEHFIAASRQRLEDLEKRKMGGLSFPVMIIDGTIFKGQHLIVAIGVERSGQKVVLGLKQGATENATVVGGLLGDLLERGIDFSEPRLYLVDGSRAIHKAISMYAGEAAFFQRCQVHKIRNVVEYLTEEQRGAVHYQMRSAYSEPDAEEGLRMLQALENDLDNRNPSAAGSLREGMAETLTVAELRVPPKLRRSLASTNSIESGFSLVERICSRVTRWQGKDHRLRWVASALVYAETRWNRITGYKYMPQLVAALEAAYQERLRSARLVR